MSEEHWLIVTQVHNESMGYQSQTLHHGEDVGGMKDTLR
jgi:hypothetical protein